MDLIPSVLAIYDALREALKLGLVAGFAGQAGLACNRSEFLAMRQNTTSKFHEFNVYLI